MLYSDFGARFSHKNLWSGETSQFVQAAIGASTIMDGADRQEIDWLAQTAINRKHIEDDKRSNNPLYLGFKCFEYLEALGVSLRDSEQIFVAMWFGSDEQSKIYNEAIRPAIDKSGYIPVRIDNTEHNEKIDDQILAEIRKSKAVVVDLTCGLSTPKGWSDANVVGSPRGGVFYEAGFAQGLGIPVIWTIKSEIAEVENVVHFDVRQFNQIRWSADHTDFAERLKLRIEATLGRGPIG